MKKLFNGALALAFTFLLSFNALANENEISVVLDNKELSFNQNPLIIDNTTMVPMRTIFEEMDFTVTWDGETRTIYGEKDGTSLLLTIDNIIAYKDGMEIMLTSPPIIHNDTTYVPIRFISESSGKEVSWDGENKIVYINSPENLNPPVIEEPVVDEPIIDEPVIDEPVVDEPVVDEPVIDEPVVDEPVVDEPVIDEPVVENPEDLTIDELTERVVTLYTDNTQGSGVIISEDGYIVTNYHVLENQDSVSVLFSNGNRYEDTVYIAGYNATYDILILKIDENELPYAFLGDSSSVKANDSIFTISSPNNTPNTVTYGEILNSTEYIIDSSAKIAEGSSGGALFNEKGELIGITTAINEFNDSISTPINIVKTINHNSLLPIEMASSISPELIAPEYVSFIYSNGEAKLGWGRVYGADEYRIYHSFNENGPFEPLLQHGTNTNSWHWGGNAYSVYFIEPTTLDIYVKISSVKNGVESETSPVYKLEIIE